MSFFSILGLAFALFILAISPGPGVFLTLSRALSSGFYAALLTIAGIVLGDLIYVLIAIFGLSLVTQTSPYLSLAIQIPLAIYLIWHGLQSWLTATQTAASQAESDSPLRWQFFIEGLVITLSNPKAILFYSAFLPNFVDLTKINTIDLAVIFVTVTGVIGGILTLYALFAAKMQRLLRSPNWTIGLNRLSASVIIFAGLFILLRTIHSA